MTSKALYTGMTALSLVAASILVPAMAVAAPAAAPAPTRITTPLTRSGTDTGMGDHDATLAGAGFLIAALAVVAAGIGLYVAVDSNDSPNSP